MPIQSLWLLPDLCDLGLCCPGIRKPRPSIPSGASLELFLRSLINRTDQSEKTTCAGGTLNPANPPSS
ncbi:hypothetical protein EYF80_060911 [Liparis tanakae]|uniref:Uncharacterized protein n=1 Tax=Liparis tanakae TaxID=230148 RepID=A0A4Z2EKP7_9TELE|nr:hypothetical protein EYF80_060911 [Liparis tanakae]